jgi:magnesium chelatase family protein
VPADCADEARLVGGIEVMAVASISEAVDALRSRRRAPPRQPDRVELATSQGPGSSQPTGPAGPPSLAIPIEVSDLADVRGHVEARRALQVTLAGGHGLLLIGPPGTGKTLMARTIPSLLPPLGDEEAFAATIVASVSGEGPIRALVRTAPFRSSHHTSSYAAIVGGGPALMPGEVTRVDQGVLFSDEPSGERALDPILSVPSRHEPASWPVASRGGRA